MQQSGLYTLKQRKQVLYIIAAFFIVYSSISLVNHYNFRTFALDLGMFNQALYAYSRGLAAPYTLDPSGIISPFLATHFSPITILYTPFYYLFGSYTLLLVQICSILSGAYGTYKLSMQLTRDNHKASLLILMQFLMTWGIFSALAFDFHNNVVGAMLVPWLMYYFVKGSTRPLLLVTLLLLMTQETMALWVPFIFCGLLLNFKSIWTRKQLLFLYLPIIIGSIAYALFIIIYVMPMLQEQQQNLQLTRYSHLGATAADIVQHIIVHPADTIKLLFTNILDDRAYDFIKTEFYIALLLSGGIFLCLRPAFLIMLIPLLAQKMLSNNYAFWGTNVQYSIEYIPLACAATISFFSTRKARKNTILYVSLFATIVTTIRLLDTRVAKWYLPENTRLYQAAHYRSFVNNQEVYQTLSLLPAQVPVSTSSRLAPHIANRMKLYHFPVVKDAAYIVLLKSEKDIWPLDAKAYFEQIDAYKKDIHWETVQETKDVILLRKKAL
ncbi:hypothetical protein DBR32_04085 [Taibaiella sp. KBW10]|uniref:DUF2079 domain-containing protein n=1 Tax=Taibaiella sp. KBW10 TaxID=2153357 RepID=UPI000F59D038|nr:DUF2079 domain-containing protein [Taibaiella sp. KBW10]RQO31988.1 hypothetical protein DBR32_04085 [Taibaiella sp. KBW10]